MRVPSTDFLTQPLLAKNVRAASRNMASPPGRGTSRAAVPSYPAHPRCRHRGGIIAGHLFAWLRTPTASASVRGQHDDTQTAREDRNMPHRKPYEDVRVEGHLIDSQIVSKMMDDIVENGGEFETLRFEVGRTNEDPSVAEIRVIGRDQAHLSQLMTAVLGHGAMALDPHDAEFEPAPCDGVFPERFYSTTNMDTFVRMGGEWERVRGSEMDLGIRIDPEAKTCILVPMGEVREGDLFVVGHMGIRVVPVERPREKAAFEFMNSAVSSDC